MGYEDDVIRGMKSYFDSYRERYNQKSEEDALRATRNWAEGLIKAFKGGSIRLEIQEKIEKKLNELRLQ